MNHDEPKYCNNTHLISGSENPDNWVTPHTITHYLMHYAIVPVILEWSMCSRLALEKYLRLFIITNRLSCDPID